MDRSVVVMSWIGVMSCCCGEECHLDVMERSVVLMLWRGALSWRGVMSCCGVECCLDVMERSVVLMPWRSVVLMPWRSVVLMLWRGVLSISEVARDRNVSICFCDLLKINGVF